MESQKEGLLTVHPEKRQMFEPLRYKPGYFSQYADYRAISVAARPKAWVCGRSLARIAGSNPSGGMDICRECCVLSGRGLCDGLINPPDNSYRMWCVSECDREAPTLRRP